MNYNIFFIFSGALWAVELIPQLIKTVKTKKVNDFSLCFPLICASAYLCFFIGCIGQKNKVLLFSHLMPFLSLLILIFLILKYRNKKQFSKEIITNNILKKNDNIVETKLICKVCNREAPNKKFITKKGCVSCDASLYL